MSRHSCRLALALLAAAAARAQGPLDAADAAASRRSDALTLSGQLDDLTPGGGGGGGALDWTRTLAGSNVLSLGIARYKLADSRWHYARAAGALHAGESLVLFGQASLGSGRNASGTFAYRIAGIGIDRRLTSGLHLKLDDQYFDVDTTRGHLPRASAVWLPNGDWTVEGAYAHSVGGNLASRYGSLRVDRNHPAARPFGGIALGRSRPEVFNVGVGAAGGEQRSRQAFFGVALPIGGRELTAVLNRLDVGEVRRLSLTVALKSPLGR